MMMGQYDEIKAALDALRVALNRNGTRVDVKINMIDVTAMGDEERKYCYTVSATATKQTVIV